MNNKLLISACCTALALGGCGGSGSGGNTANSNTTINGSGGDGPVVGASVVVTDANGATVVTTPANPVTDATAHYSFSVPSNTATPVVITLTGGTDSVTGKALDFPLMSAVTSLPPSGAITGNANPLSTLAVETALLKNGKRFTAAQLQTAVQTVSASLGFGLATGINPITTPADTANIASIVKANEAVAELIRRTKVSVGLSTEMDALDALAADLTDGKLDGQADASVPPRPMAATVAAVALVKAAELTAELLANQLTITDDLGATLVTGAQSVAALNSSITTTQPTATGNDADVSGVVPTQALLDQAKAAITVANRLTVGGSNPDLTNLLGIINTLTAGGTLTAGQITQITTLLPAVGC